MIEAKHLTLEEFWKEFGISRATAFNWVKRDKPPPSNLHRERLVKFFDQPRSFVLFGVVDESKTGIRSAGASVEERRGDYANLRDNTGQNPDKGMGKTPSSSVIGNRMTIDPRFSAPATRRDCEEYFAELMRRVAAHGDANDFPAIYKQLQKVFPLQEFEPATTPP